MSVVQALWLAVLQGFSELFPISSIGHTVLIPKLLGWSIDQDTFLPFLVTLHLGTAAALLLFFWGDWVALVSAFVRSVVRGKRSRDADEHLAWMLVFGTIPTGILGLFLETPLRRLFGAPLIAAVFLIVNGFVRFAGERLRLRSAHAAHETLESLTWPKAVIVGAAQSAALIPGISRSGTTIVAGLLTGLKHEAAARFSFLLATPIIAAAGLLEVPKLMATP
jgi:undecaprenyl-diphosphatase